METTTQRRWRRIKEIFDAAEGLAGEDRTEYLNRACAGDDELRREVCSLLDWSDEPDSRLEQGPSGLHASLAAEISSETPARIGPYRIERELGAGGMGAVFLGVRDDGAFQKKVAIKLLQPGLSSAGFRERFDRERHILARLEHANIARLLDGGTADGRSYLVMEYVAGENLTAHCSDLDLRPRIAIFLEACDAVSYAHRNLVVHRDLKPGNILVTREGAPKLLDFGLARLMEDTPGAEATKSAAWMTPQYASPEQVRGEPAAVAADVYSLGMILFELLAEKRPYEVSSVSPLEAARQICDVDVRRPSEVAASEALRRALRGDLDNITLRAVAKDTAQRYASVEQLAADLRAYLEGRPVKARRPTVAYRAAKFVRRNRIAVALASLALAAAGAGIGSTLWQARRAQAAFTNVRAIADTMLFEIHDSIAKLPGSTPSRELLVRRALEYLDRLSRETSGDEALQADVAAAYLRIGDVQGGPNSSLGHPAAARQSYLRAATYYEGLLGKHPENWIYRRGLARTYGQLASMSPAKEAGEYARKALAVLQTGPALPVSTPEYLLCVGTAHFDLAGAATRADDYAGALREYDAARTQFREAIAKQRTPELERDLALVEKYSGGILGRLKRNDEAVAHYEAARAIDEQRVREHPEQTETMLDLAFDLGDLGFFAHRRGDHAASRDFYVKSVALRRRASEADTQNAWFQNALANGLSREARELDETGGYAAAIQAGREAVGIGRELVARGKPGGFTLAQREQMLADIYLAHGEKEKACEFLEAAVTRVPDASRLSKFDAADFAEMRAEREKNCGNADKHR